ncbi:oxygenase MpaB family protein [Nocardia beijingensis]|uniref:oxygenase MpaB family protein n=1 Tax=Nocardia beijingensis TaxID=95162 RepID=UPI003A5D0449
MGRPADQLAEAEWLKQRHRDLHGRGRGDYHDVRYGALNPQTWIWVGVSGMFVALSTFTYCTGTVLRPEEKEAAYQLLYVVRYHRKYALDSFAPPSDAAGGCPT